jgi:hypothetical protein
MPPPADDEEPPPAADSRLLLVESEFARTLTVMARPDNTLSMIIRQAWETGSLDVMTRKDPLQVKDAHVSIIGHITTDELRKNLNVTERANGFANRFMFFMVKRSQELPFGGDKIDYQTIVPELIEARLNARQVGRMKLSASFKELWPKEYSRLTAEHPGMFGAITSRAESHVMRLAMIYALLDRSTEIDAVHLKAALEVWRYCEDSVRYIFGTSLGDDTADTILQELRKQPDGLARTEISKLFHNNKEASEIKRALKMLERVGLAVCEQEETAGRKRETWFVAENEKRSDLEQGRQLNSSKAGNTRRAKVLARTGG